MGLPERAVAALARGYSMSEVLPLDDPNVRGQLETAASADQDLTFRVVARGIVMDGELQEDSDGCLAELARDLGLAGVDEVRIPPSVASGGVENFIRSLRSGIDELRRNLEDLPGISISFRSVASHESFGPEGDLQAAELSGSPSAPQGTGMTGSPLGGEPTVGPASEKDGSGPAPDRTQEPSDPPEGDEFATGPGFVRDLPATVPEDEEEDTDAGAPGEAVEAFPDSVDFGMEDAWGGAGAGVPAGEAKSTELGDSVEAEEAEEPAGTEAPTEPGEAEEPEWAREAEESPPPEPSPPEPPVLMPLVDDYLEEDALERGELADEIREAVEEAMEMGAFGRVAEVVEELVLDAELGSRRPESLELARDLYGPEVAAAIVRRLGVLRDDVERDRRIRVATTLRGPMAEAFAEALTETDDRGARHAYLDALIALGEDGRAQAKEMLEDDRWWVVRNGATILGGTGTRSDVEDLTTHLAHDDARVRLQVVRALARIGGEDAGMLLLGMVDDPDPDVRAAVATALGALGLDRAVKSLLERLEIEEEEKVVVQILRALGALGDPGAVPSIEKRAAGTFFSRPPTPVRVAAYRALGSIGTPRATQLLREALDDRDDEVRRAARAVLERREG